MLQTLIELEGTRQTLLTHIEGIVMDSLPDVESMPDVAHQLGMSERSLRRKLDDAGTSFREIVDQVRQTRALEMVLQSDLPIQSIAEQLGFEDARSLRRRLTEWTGRSARELRAEAGRVLKRS